MIFKNREHAADLLSERLKTYKNSPDAIVLGLARGGGELAFFLAKKLQIPFNFLFPRKLKSPISSELAIGAISEKGQVVLLKDLGRQWHVSEHYLEIEIAHEKKEIQAQVKLFRPHLPFPDLSGKIVILVDDGIATGATFLAEERFLKTLKIRKLVCAAPIIASDAFDLIEKIADETAFLNVEESFGSISQFYEDFSQVENETLLHYIEQSKKQN